MKNTPQFPAAIFDGCTTGNTDRDERNDDCQPDFHDFDQLAAELISVQTVVLAADTEIGYIPLEPANGSSYILSISANGVASWTKNYLPTTAPANGAIYNLAVDANGIITWAVDANG